MFNKILSVLLLISPNFVFASSTSVENSNLLLWLAIITLFAIFARSSVKIGQPTVLGQLILGVILGVLSHYNVFGLSEMLHNSGIAFFAELGSIFLLLEIGLESSVSDIKNAGKHAILVAIVGVILPFLLGYFIVVPFILGSDSFILKVFFGSMLAVTSTGISVSVFKDLGIIKSEACQIVLASSVIDDICGLILLSMTVGFMVVGVINFVSIGLILWDVLLFFVVSILFGLYVLPFLIKLISKINNNSDTVTLIIIAFGLFMAYCAGKIGLTFIIGAFIAGLLLYPQMFAGFIGVKGKPDFKENHHQLEYLIAPYGKIFTPLFFIYAGMQVDIVSVFNGKTLFLTLLISIVAILGKIFAGVFLPKRINKWMVGIGMTPRGEIGLIFAITGLNLEIIDNNIFAIILLMIMVTSIVTSIVINYLAKRDLRSVPPIA